MPERHEQEAGIADNGEDRPAQDHQRHSAAPSDPEQIAEAGADHERQECDAGPEIAMSQQIGGREPGLQAMPGGGETERPAQGCAHAAGNAKQRLPRFLSRNSARPAGSVIADAYVTSNGRSTRQAAGLTCRRPF